MNDLYSRASFVIKWVLPNYTAYHITFSQLLGILSLLISSCFLADHTNSRRISLFGIRCVLSKHSSPQLGLHWLYFMWWWRLMPPKLVNGDFVWNMWFPTTSQRTIHSHRWLYRVVINVWCTVYARETAWPFSIRMGLVNCSQLLPSAWASIQIPTWGWSMWFEGMWWRTSMDHIQTGWD